MSRLLLLSATTLTLASCGTPEPRTCLEHGQDVMRSVLLGCAQPSACQDDPFCAEYAECVYWNLYDIDGARECSSELDARDCTLEYVPECEDER